jgi:hypothetical protein
LVDHVRKIGFTDVIYRRDLAELGLGAPGASDPPVRVTTAAGWAAVSGLRMWALALGG